jgi:hypothetical protein
MGGLGATLAFVVLGIVKSMSRDYPLFDLRGSALILLFISLLIDTEIGAYFK